MTLVASSIFRLATLCFLFYTVHFAHNLIHGQKAITIQSSISMLKFLTILNLFLNIIYYIVASPLQCCRCFKLHGSIYCTLLTYSALVCSAFWSIFLYDPELLWKQSAHVPSWFNHSSHTFPLVALLLDAFFWKPHTPPVLGTALTITSIGLLYNAFVEYLIQAHNIFVYPILDRFPTAGRYGLYSVFWVSILVFFVLCHKMICFINLTYQKSHSKPQSKVDKSQAMQSQTHQKKKNRKTD